MTLRRYSQTDIKGKKVLLRLDLDVVVNEKGIVDEYHDLRLERAVGTIQELLSFGATQIIMCGHRGRPEGQFDASLSLAPVKERLGWLLNKAGVQQKIDLIRDMNAQPNTVGQLAMLENLRFYPGEKNNDTNFARLLSVWGEVYINDAFGASHRADASMVGIVKIIAKSFAGPSLLAEITNQEKFLNNLTKPFIIILGGIKISTKLSLIKKFIGQADYILLGGGLANTVLASRGLIVGQSVIDKEMLSEAKALRQDNIVLPLDLVVRTKNAQIAILEPTNVGDDDFILDIGPKTVADYAERVKTAQAVLWNGPMGKFEDKNAEQGTMALAQTMAEHGGQTLAGGGDTVVTLEQLNLIDKFGFVSGGGGAMLTFLSGEPMLALEILSSRPT